MSPLPPRHGRCALAPAVVLALALATLGGCEALIEQDLRVLLPEDQSSLASIDNASLVLLPDNRLASYPVDGVDFTLELEVPDGGGPYAVELYLADGDELKAWGRSASFLVGGTALPTVFVGAPGALSTFPRAIDSPDPQTHAAVLTTDGSELGALLVTDSGDTFFFNALTLESTGVATLPEPDAFAGGGLWSTSEARALRFAWEGTARAAEFDPAGSQWRSLDIEDPDGALVGLAADAPHITDSAGERLLLWSANGARSLSLREDTNDTQPRESIRVEAYEGSSAPDAAREGGRAFWSDADSGVLGVFGGGPDADPPALVWIEGVGPLGSAEAWSGASCVTLDAGGRIVCGGGLRAGTPSADLVSIELEGGTWSLTESPNALSAPMREPLMWLHGDALYAQGEGRLRALDPMDLQAEAGESAAQRHVEGQFFQLSTGATFLVGGADASGAALTRWQVFTPALVP